MQYILLIHIGRTRTERGGAAAITLPCLEEVPRSRASSILDPPKVVFAAYICTVLLSVFCHPDGERTAGQR